jgi:hypothetical protein
MIFKNTDIKNSALPFDISLVFEDKCFFWEKGRGIWEGYGSF